MPLSTVLREFSKQQQFLSGLYQLAAVLFGVGCWVLLNTVFPIAAQAQVGYDLMLPNQPNGGEQLVSINGWDQTREANGLVMYTSDYGPTTRTNAYGIEVVLKGVAGQPNTYQVQPNPSLEACNQGKGLPECGNTAIPANGVVLSAHGSSKATLVALKPGSQVVIQPRWFAHASRAISVINPNYSNNGRYCSFPGCRGGGQLVIYTPEIGRPKTGTNEFGFEATVVDGRVVAHEGSDSTIPPNGFVLSAHGSARDWLIPHAPIGAAIQLATDGSVVTTTVDAETYQRQLLDRLQHAESRRLCGTWYLPRRADENPCLKTEQAMASAQAQLETGNGIVAAQQFHALTKQLNQEIWESHMPFAKDAVKAVWHRPVEQSREEVGRTLDFLKASGLNTVFLETFFHGYTVFPSQTMAKYGLPEKNPTQTMADPLAVWIDEAHKRGIQLHTWMETFYAGNKVAPPSTDSEMGPILGKYPQWGNQSYAGRDSETPDVSTLETGAYFIDPANPEAKAFLLALMEETATRYAIDGLQLDYIRYPSSLPKNPVTYLTSSWGYSAVARQQFVSMGGIDPNSFTGESILKEHAPAWAAWQHFKITQVNEFVHTVDQRLEATVQRPGFTLSAAVFPREEDSIARKHQDWPTWVANQWVDMLCPMTLTSALKVIAADTNHVVRVKHELNHPRLRVVSGIFGPFNGNEADLVLQQIDVARENRADGFSLFDSAHLTGRVGKAVRLAQEKK